MPVMKEVEITPHHRPIEWVWGVFWGFILLNVLMTLCFLFIHHPSSLSEFWDEVMNGFLASIALVIMVISLLGILYIHGLRKAMVVDIGQFGTVLVKGKKTTELAPLIPDVQPQASVSLVTPSKKAGDYLPYVKLADYLKAKGVELQDLEDCIDPPEPLDVHTEPPAVHLTELQKKVLGSWDRGNHGRKSIHDDLKDVSEHMAAITIAELKAKGVIE